MSTSGSSTKYISIEFQGSLSISNEHSEWSTIRIPQQLNTAWRYRQIALLTCDRNEVRRTNTFTRLFRTLYLQPTLHNLVTWTMPLPLPLPLNWFSSLVISFCEGYLMFLKCVSVGRQSRSTRRGECDTKSSVHWPPPWEWIFQLPIWKTASSTCTWHW